MEQCSRPSSVLNESLLLSLPKAESPPYLPIIWPPEFLLAENLKKPWVRLAEDERLERLADFAQRYAKSSKLEQSNLYQFLVEQGHYLDRFINYENGQIAQIRGLSRKEAGWQLAPTEPKLKGNSKPVHRVHFLSLEQLTRHLG